MKRSLILLSILVLFALLSSCTGAAPATPSPTARTATFVMLDNDVQARARARDDYQVADLGQVLPIAGQARTGDASKAQLDLMPDEAVIRMGPGTIFVLEELSDQTDDFFARLKMEAGDMWIILNGGELQVETDLGVASVRGSMMRVIFRPDVSLVIICLEGTCVVTNDAGTSSAAANQAVEVYAPGHAPLPARGLSSGEVDDWMDILSEVHRGPRVGDRVWLDSNWDGIQDPLEEGLASVSVGLFNAEDQMVAMTSTDAEGLYSFPFVAPGTYYLLFSPPADYLFTLNDIGAENSLDSDPDPLTGRTALFDVLASGEVLIDWDAGMYPVWAAPAATATPTSTPEPPPPCGCYTPGVILELVVWDGSPGWSDCGQATACHSIIGNSLVETGTVIGNSTCSMRLTCPTP